MDKRSLALLVALLACVACGEVQGDLATGTQREATSSCTRCHGSGSDPAPAPSVLGETSTASIAVGAHQAHLRDGALHRGFACAECHRSVVDSSHIDGVATVTFGTIASAGGAATGWDRERATCSTYCHGQTLGGGTNTAPGWTRAGGSEAACGSCHGLPPPAPHAASAECGTCHAGYTATSVDLSLHVNGRVDLTGGAGGATAGACGSCHAVPPPAPHTSSTDCGSCHSGYSATSTNPTIHRNGTVDVAAASPASCASCHGVPPPAPHTASTSCGDCHPGFTASSANPAIHRNGVIDVALTAASCTSCHGLPPSSGQHTRSQHRDLSCGACHGSGYSRTTVDSTRHADGVRNVGGTGSLINSWNAETRSCGPSCHGSKTW